MLQAASVPEDISTANENGQPNAGDQEQTALPLLEAPYMGPGGDPEWPEYLCWLANQADQEQELP